MAELKKDRICFRFIIQSVCGGFATVLVNTISVQPPGCTILDFTLPVLILPITDSVSCIREGAHLAAGPAVVIIRVQVYLAAIFCRAITVSPPFFTGFDVARAARTAVLRVGKHAPIPAGPAVFYIGHQVNAVIGREDTALGEAGATCAG